MLGFSLANLHTFVNVTFAILSQLFNYYRRQTNIQYTRFKSFTSFKFYLEYRSLVKKYVSV